MTPEVFITAGLAYGDEGKGAIVDALVRKHNASLVVRYNGGSQCGHNVVTPDGRHHCFSQFGAGSFVPEVHTHLSRYMLVNPLNMTCEEEHLREVGITNIWNRTTVDGRCLIITPYQKAVNRIYEMFRGNTKHGSCGQGVGVTRGDHLVYHDKVLFARDLASESVTKIKLEFIRQVALNAIKPLGCNADALEARVIFNSDSVDWIWQQYKHWPARVINGNPLAALLEEHPCVVFEGAQGVLLDEIYGQAPYHTWTDTTFNNAHSLLKDIGFNGKVNKIGVLRTYVTRHGAGPLETEDDSLTYPELHNTTNKYQDNFRLGRFDWVNTEYALTIVGGVDYLALNHMDVLSQDERWELHARLGADFAPIGIDGCGPTFSEKYFTG